MAEEDTVKKASGGITKLMATFGTGLVVFFATQLWRFYEKTSEVVGAMERRLESLEEDKSKWGTLTELHNRTVSMEIEMSRLQGRMEGFSLAVQGGMVEKPAPASETPAPPAVSPEQQKLVDPKDLFKNPEDYRQMQQKKYPGQEKK